MDKKDTDKLDISVIPINEAKSVLKYSLVKPIKPLDISESTNIKSSESSIKTENLSESIFNEKISIDEKILKLYRPVTGRTPIEIELIKLKEFFNEVQNLNDIEDRKAFNSLTVLVYNLDETTQKS